QDEHGNQPLWTAVQSGDYEMTSLLVEHGADPDHENKVGKSPLSIAEEADAHKFIEILK
ncbi:ankyrin repeat domain-containing protein, partial [Halogeometricum borinquense]